VHFDISIECRTAWVSLGRVERFLRQTELLDRHTSTVSPSLVLIDDGELGIANAKFTFSMKNDTTSGGFTLSIPHRLVFPSKEITMVLGPTGAGKTALLLALLGEMHAKSATDEQVWIGLPRSKGVSYAAQEGWVMSATVRENIVFGQEWDVDRYNAGKPSQHLRVEHGA
jgi:ABC-type multidrug transport system fused ATPase/permease subunit